MDTKLRFALKGLSITALALVYQLLAGSSTDAGEYQVGVYYFPGWHSKTDYWNDLKGLPGSRSPGRPWPEREPLLGYYDEDAPATAEKHIEWASLYGVTFFAYDWYWWGTKADSNLTKALNSYLKAKNKDKLKFCLLWANHSEIPRSLSEFDNMIAFWAENYFRQPNYFLIEGKPAIFIFDYQLLDQNARKFGRTGAELLARGDMMARKQGGAGIYFVATTNDRPSSELEGRILSEGYSAYTGWNYVISKEKAIEADYDSMVDTYMEFYGEASKTRKKLPYIVPASPGWDARPWKGNKPFVYYRLNPTPQKFEKMLTGAKKLMDAQKSGPKILMIEAWNEFGEGAYIEPTKRWGMQYLEIIRKVFKTGAAAK